MPQETPGAKKKLARNSIFLSTNREKRHVQPNPSYFDWLKVQKQSKAL